jgi:DivIVA domain-containing protein
VLSFLLLVVGVLVIGGLLFLGASLLLGRGETQPPADLDRSPVELPDDRPIVGDDVRALQISVAVRGYRMTEVDWLLDQFAQALDQRDAELARLRGRPTPADPAPTERAPAAAQPPAEVPGPARETADVPDDGARRDA